MIVRVFAPSKNKDNNNMLNIYFFPSCFIGKHARRRIPKKRPSFVFQTIWFVYLFNTSSTFLLQSDSKTNIKSVNLPQACFSKT